MKRALFALAVMFAAAAIPATAEAGTFFWSFDWTVAGQWPSRPPWQ